MWIFFFSAEGSSQQGRNQGTDETVTVKNCASFKGNMLLQSLVAGFLVLFF
jgi:hypothetical protein